jgi:hypothetical protein
VGTNISVEHTAYIFSPEDGNRMFLQNFGAPTMISKEQGHSVDVLSVSCVSPANTLRNKKQKVSYFHGLVVLHTLEHNRTDQIKRIISQLQPASG